MNSSKCDICGKAPNGKCNTCNSSFCTICLVSLAYDFDHYILTPTLLFNCAFCHPKPSEFPSIGIIDHTKSDNFDWPKLFEKIKKRQNP